MVLKEEIATNGKFRAMHEKAMADLKKKGIPEPVINHNENLFCDLVASLSTLSPIKERINPVNILWLSLYHENFKDPRMLPYEIKSSIGGLFKQFIELKALDMSDKNTWASYSKLIEYNPELVLFRMVDLTHMELDKETLVKFYNFDRRNAGKQIKNVAGAMLYVYAPIADMLGQQKVLDALRNKSTSILYPQFYTDVCKIIKEIKDDNELIEKLFFTQLEEDMLYSTISDNGAPITFSKFRDGSIIKHRIKSAGSITLKLIKENKPASELFSLGDLVAFTVLTETIEGAFAFADYLCRKYDLPKEKVDDFITYPRGETKYQSLHIPVPIVIEKDGTTIHREVEVQIRTPEMQVRCEEGDWAHALYKPNKLEKEQLLKASLYAGSLRNVSKDEIEQIGLSLRPTRIFVSITYEGGVMQVDLPKNSCIYDLVCKVSDPLTVHEVASLDTTRRFSMYDLVQPNGRYSIQRTREKMSPGIINQILPICSVETRMKVEQELRKKKG